MNAFGGRSRLRKGVSVAAVIALAAAEYLWTLAYYGGLYRAGRLLSASGVTPDRLCSTLIQHIGVSIPGILAALAGLCLLRGRFARQMGFVLPKGRGRAATLCVLAVYAALLIAAWCRGKETVLSIAYQWLYYLIVVALEEEWICRAAMPALLDAGGLPARWIYILPGVLFGLMHTMMPLIMEGPAAAAKALSSVMGYAVFSYVMLRLKEWSGTLLFPVLIHATLDFLGVAFS